MAGTHEVRNVRRARVGVALAVVALVAAGCTNDGSKGGDATPTSAASPPAGTWAVEAPSSAFGGSGETISLAASVVADDGGGPVYLAGDRRESPDKPSQPVVLVSGGDGWTPVSSAALAVENAGIGDLASSGDAVTAVGYKLVGGRAKPVVWTGQGTKDDAWRSKVLDATPDTDAFLYRVAPLDDGTFVAAGIQGPDDKGQRQLLVGRSDAAGEWTFQTVASRLPFSFVVSVAAHGSNVLVAGLEESPAGGQPTAWYSSDRGASFTEAPDGSFGGPRSGAVTSVQWVEDRFVAFGAAENSTDLAAWSSVDGGAWSPLDASIGGAPIPILPQSSTVRSGPRGSAVVALPGKPREERYSAYLVSYAPQRTPQWTAEPYPDELLSTGIVTGPGPVAITDEGQIVLTVDLPGTVAIGRSVANSNSLRVTKPGTIPLPPVSTRAQAAALAVAGDRRLVSGGEGPVEKGKTIGFAPRLWRGGPDGWSKTDQLPDELANVIDVAARPEGGFVVLGFTNGIQGVEATPASFGSRATVAQRGSGTDVNDLWVGTMAADGKLTRTGIIAGPGEQEARSITRVGDTWYVAGFVQPDQNDPEQEAAIWSSKDLAEWTQVDAELGRGTVSDVCAAPGGGVLAVGDATDDKLVSFPAAWMAGGDGDFRRVTDGVPTSQGSLLGCDSSSDVAVVVGSADQNPVVLTLRGGTFSTSSFPATRNVFVTKVIHTEKGFLLGGSDETRFRNRAVLWTSADGTTFTAFQQPEALVGFDGSELVDIGLDGDRVLVLGDSGPLPVLWSVTNPFG